MPRSARNLSVPFRPGDVIDARIEAFPLGPDSIARARGYVLFVPGGVPGEEVSLRVTDVSRRYGRGEIVRVKTPSPNRARPFCPYFLRCGGCHVQHLTQAARLRTKRELLASTLEHALKRRVSVAPIEPLSERGYRDKVSLVLAPDGPGGIRAGFYKAHSHELVPIDACPIQETSATRLALETVAVLRDVGARAFDEDRGAGEVRHVLVRAGTGTGELSLVLVLARADRPRWLDRALERLRALSPAPVGIALNVSPRREGELVLGEETHLVSGRARYRTVVEGIEYHVSPTSFFQTNGEGAAAIVRTVARMLSPLAGARVFDVYGGAGLLGFALAKRGARVLLVEGNKTSIADARATAAATGISLSVRRGRAEDVVPRLAREGTRANGVVLDPPREGCHPRVLSAIARAIAPATLAYVSCEPLSLARDLAVLESTGYRMLEVVPIDMFPHAFHVEAVARLTRVAH